MTGAFVVGGAGFIGSSIARRLVEDGLKVVVIDNLATGYIENLPVKAHFLNIDATDADAVENAFHNHKPDFVFNAASFASENWSHNLRAFTYRNNILSNANLVNSSIRNKVERFVLLSSAAVYGNCRHADTYIDADPIDPYGVSKLACEGDLVSAYHEFGLSYTIFRLHNVYGPGQSLTDKSRNVVGIFINQAMAGKPLTIYGNGEQERQFTYIDDLVGPIVESVRMKNLDDEILNAGNDQSHSINDLVGVLRNFFPNQPTINLPARNEANVVVVDNRKFSRIFKILKYTGLHDGIDQTIKWVINNPDVRNRYRELPKLELER